MTRNHRWAAAGLIAAALTVTACGTGSSSAGSAGASGAYSAPAGSSGQSAAAPASAPGTAQTTALKTETTSAGTVLATSRGLTLYYFTEDKPGSGTSSCTGSCATTWPPLTAPAQAPAGVTLPGPLGVITRSGGVRQVTVKGYPVYTYAGDRAPGQASGNGVEGEWHVIKIS
jgi:predicted lipoprotein with Yx(FWY)xxD motif